MNNTLPFLRSIKKSYLIIILIAILLTIGVIGFIKKPEYNTIYTIKRENLVNTVVANGTYTTASQTLVYSPTNGIISKIFVNNKNEVKRGDSLFHVDSSATPDQQKTAYTNYLTANAVLQADNAELYTLQSEMYSAWKTYTDIAKNSTYQNSDGSPRTTNRVLTEFTTVQNDWLAAEAKYKNQQSVIAKDQAALSAAKQLYDQTQSVTVIAPADGTIVNLRAKTGDQASTITSTASIPVLLIADFRNPVITASINEINISRIKTGQKVQIVFDALPDKEFTGRVENIDEVGTKTQGAIMYNVVITAYDLTPDVKSNLTASITIETAGKENIITVPNNALLKKDGKTYVQKEGSYENSLTEIKLGLKGLTKTEVIDGLSAGDRVIIQE